MKTKWRHFNDSLWLSAILHHSTSRDCLTTRESSKQCSSPWSTHIRTRIIVPSCHSQPLKNAFFKPFRRINSPMYFKAPNYPKMSRMGKKVQIILFKGLNGDATFIVILHWLPLSEIVPARMNVFNVVPITLYELLCKSWVLSKIPIFHRQKDGESLLEQEHYFRFDCWWLSCKSWC